MSCRSKREMAPLPLHATGSTTPLPDVVARDLGDGVPPPVGQPGWWSGSLPQVTLRGTMSPNCGMDYYPPGGFMSYFQAGQQPFPPLHVPFPAQWPPVSKEFQHAPPSSDLGAQPDEARSKGKTKQTRKKGGKTIINIDDGNDVRTAKRLVFEPNEDLRLVSAWLFHSNDPINWNCKKNESYWGDVHAQYNSTTPTNRRRQVKHLKDRWQKIKRWVGVFCGAWKKATLIYTSGQLDDQLRDKALQFYLDDYKEGPFTVLHCWKVLRDEPKWLAILEDQDKSNKMSADDESNKRSLDDGDQLRDISKKERPMGTKEAKKQRNGKGGVKNVDAGLHEELKKYMDIQAGAKQRHEDFIKILRQIMKACVILHNMIVEDEGEMAKEPLDLNIVPGASIALPPEGQSATNSNPCFNDIRRRNFAIRSHLAHTQLKNDLIEHIWQRFGTRKNN